MEGKWPQQALSAGKGKGWNSDPVPCVCAPYGRKWDAWPHTCDLCRFLAAGVLGEGGDFGARCSRFCCTPGSPCLRSQGRLPLSLGITIPHWSNGVTPLLVLLGCLEACPKGLKTSTQSAVLTVMAAHTPSRDSLLSVCLPFAISLSILPKACLVEAESTCP